MRKILLTSLLACSAFVVAQALDLPFNCIPADAAAVVDCDVGAYLASEAGQALNDAFKTIFRDRIPLEQLEQLGSLGDGSCERVITSFGFAGPESFGTVALGKFDAAKFDEMVAKMSEMPNPNPVTESTLGDRIVKTWTSPSPDGKGNAISTCLAKPGVIVFSNTGDLMKALLDVIDGNAPSLARSSTIARLAGPVSPVSWFRVFIDPKAPVVLESPMGANPQLQSLQAFRLAISGELRNITLLLDGRFDSEESAKTAQGQLLALQATGLMQTEADPSVAALLGNLSIRSEGSWAMANTHLPVDTLVKSLETAAAAAAANAGEEAEN
jgi:hypothetical protein